MRRVFIPVLASLLLAGCLEVQNEVVLRRDLSGTAEMTVHVDLEPMAYFMATLTRSFEGKSGPPTEEELAETRRDLMAEQEQDPFDPDQIKRDAAAEFPAGVELLEIAREEEGLKSTYRLKLAFDDVRKLQQVDLSGAAGPPDETSPEAGAQQEMTTPFSDLILVDEGATWLLQSPPLNPVAGSNEQMEGFGGMEGFEGMLDQIFAGLRVLFVVEVASEVVAHNATEVEGRRLTWQFDYAALKNAPFGEAGMWVRFRK